MTNKKTKVVVIGGGHNGLICASYLAKAGYCVDLHESRDSVGGGCADLSIKSESKIPGLAHVSYGINSQICRDLGLKDLISNQTKLNTISLDTRGNHIKFFNNDISGDNVSDEDRQAFKQFRKDFRKYSRALKSLMMNTPPRLKDMDGHDKLTLIKLGWNLRFGLGKKAMREFLRIGGINIFDVLNEKFDNPAIKGAIAFDAVIGHQMGPRTPNSVLSLLQKMSFEPDACLHVTTNLSQVLRQTAESFGVNITTNSHINKINVQEGTCVGVESGAGEQIDADIVISNADAKSTFLKLLGAQHLDALFAHRVNSIRQDGAVARVNLRLKKMPSIQNLSEGEMLNRLVIAPDMKYVEHAFNHSKYGEYSEQPILEILFHAMTGGKDADQEIYMSISASFAPYKLKGGWTQHRDSFMNCIFETVSNYIPKFRQLVKSYELLTPEDIEKDYNCIGGHWHHGEMGIDQSFMMRPVHGSAQYSTPIKNLFLCGACAHPGGGITGLPGYNAARQILRTYSG